MIRRGPKLRDRLDLVEHVLLMLLEDPTLGRTEIVLRTGRRKSDALRAYRLVRAAMERDPSLVNPGAAEGVCEPPA